MPSTSSTARPLIHVVDDNASFRVAVSRLLKAAGYTVETYESAPEFLRRLPDGTPGCILLDVQMPELDGLDLQAALAIEDQALPIVFVSGHGDIPMTVQAMKAGAIDFLTKPIKRETLLRAIEAALACDAEKRAACEPLLSVRETEVLLLLRDRLRNKEIARHLFISAETVKKHTLHIYKKLGVCGRREAVAAAIARGVISRD